MLRSGFPAEFILFKIARKTTIVFSASPNTVLTSYSILLSYRGNQKTLWPSRLRHNIM